MSAIDLNGGKMFAIINADNIVSDCWIANSLEEAQLDNPQKTVIEVTLENSPFILNEKYIAKE
jgi:hypothetical protein